MQGEAELDQALRYCGDVAEYHAGDAAHRLVPDIKPAICGAMHPCLHDVAGAVAPHECVCAGFCFSYHEHAIAMQKLFQRSVIPWRHGGLDLQSQVSEQRVEGVACRRPVVKWTASDFHARVNPDVGCLVGPDFFDAQTDTAPEFAYAWQVPEGIGVRGIDQSHPLAGSVEELVTLHDLRCQAGLDHLLFDRSEWDFQRAGMCCVQSMDADAIGLGRRDQFEHVEPVLRVGTQAGQIGSEVL